MVEPDQNTETHAVFWSKHNLRVLRSFEIKASEQPTRPERACKKTTGENLDLGELRGGRGKCLSHLQKAFDMISERAKTAEWWAWVDLKHRPRPYQLSTADILRFAITR